MTAPAPAPVRILVVEDEPLVARLIMRRLEDLGFAVAEAPDGRIALDLAGKEHWDVILLDHGIPEVSGLEVILALKKAGRLPPTIMISGLGREDVAVAALQQGAMDYVVKDPHNKYLDELPQRIAQVLERHRTARRLLEQEEDRQVHLASLQHRVSELGCLYGIEKLISSEGESADMVWRSATNIIPHATFHSDACCARIRVHGREYVSDNFQAAGQREIFPIREREEVVGELEIILHPAPEAEPAGFLTDPERELLTAIADRLGRYSLQCHADELQTAELKRFRVFYDLALALAESHCLEDNLQTIVGQTRSLLAADAAFIGLQEERTGVGTVAVHSGLRGETFRAMAFPPGVGLGGEVIRTRRGLIVDDYLQRYDFPPPVRAAVAEEGFLSGMGAPVQIGENILGVMLVFRRRKEGWREADLETLSLIGNLAAIEITQQRAKARLRASEEKLRAQFKGFPIPTFTWQHQDGDFTLADYNDAAAEITAGDARQLLGIKLADYAAGYPEVAADVTQCHREKKMVRRETAFRFHAGAPEKYLAVSCVHIPPDLVMMHAEDISERRQTEELRAAVLTLSAMIAGCQTEDEICRVVVEGIRGRMGVDRCGLFLSDAAGGPLRGTYGTDMQGRTTIERDALWDISKERDVEELFRRLPFRTGYPLGNPDPLPDEAGLSTTLIALRQGGRVFGIISVDNRISRRPLSELAMHHISLLAEVLGNALQVARTRAELRDSMEKVRRANEELEAFNRAMVGRENRVIELKEEVNALLIERGRPERYPPVWRRSAGDGA